MTRGSQQKSYYTVEFSVPYHNLRIYQHYLVTGDTLGIINISAVPERDGEWAYGDAQFVEALKSYMLPQILMVYGQPSGVLLRTYSGDLPGWLPFSLLLFYLDQGILVEYQGPVGEEGNRYGPLAEGEAIRVCPWRSRVTLWLWSPGRRMTIDDVTGGYLRASDYRSLEGASGMSIEQFYETFSWPANQICLETPADLW